RLVPVRTEVDSLQSVRKADGQAEGQQQRGPPVAQSKASRSAQRHASGNSTVHRNLSAHAPPNRSGWRGRGGQAAACFEQEVSGPAAQQILRSSFAAVHPP